MKTLAALAVVAVVAVGRADAQPAPWSPERLTPGWTFTPSAVFGGLWDSNVTVRNEGSPEVKEWVGLVSPRGEIDYNGRRTRFGAGYAGTLHAYRNLDDLNRYDQRVRASARRQITPRLAVETRHTGTATPTTEDLEINGLPFARVGSHAYNGRGGATYALSERTALSADYGYQWVRFDSESVEFTELRGGESHSVSSSLTRRLDSRLAAGASYAYTRARLARSEVTANIQRAMVDVAWRLGPYTAVSGALGASHVTVPLTNTSAVGPAFGVSIEHTINRARLTARYDQSFAAAYSFGSAMTHKALLGTAHVPFYNGRMFVSASGGYRRAAPVDGANLIRLDSVLTQTTLGYHVARWIRMEAFYNGSFQDSSARGEYNRSRIGVQFVTTKPVRIQ